MAGRWSRPERFGTSDSWAPPAVCDLIGLGYTLDIRIFKYRKGLLIIHQYDLIVDINHFLLVIIYNLLIFKN